MPQQKLKFNITRDATGFAGHALLVLGILQAISAIVVVFLQYLIINHISNTPQERIAENDIASSILRPFLRPTTRSLEASEPNILFVIAAWVALISATVFLLAHTSRLSSKLLRFMVAKYWGRVTAKKLLITKLVTLLLSLVVIVTSSLLIPAITYIIPLNIALTAIGAICFIAQHAMYKHNKTPVKHML